MRKYAIRLLLVSGLALSIAQWIPTGICAGAPYPPFIQPDAAGNTPAREQKMWALAACAVLTKSNGDRLDLLGGSERTEEKIKSQIELLDKWWEIRNRDDLLNMLKWIEDGGHRKRFDDLAWHLANLSPAQIDDARTATGVDSEGRNKIDVVLKYYRQLGAKSITAWDYDRYILLCGWGYLVGYLSEDEAWQYIMPAARLLQKTFSSWEELSRNYLIGREFWSLQHTTRRYRLMQECYQALLSDPTSPWRTIPWDADLGGNAENASPTPKNPSLP